MTGLLEDAKGKVGDAGGDVRQFSTILESVKRDNNGDLCVDFEL